MKNAELRNELSFETEPHTLPPLPTLIPHTTLHLWTKLTLSLTECTLPWVNTQWYVWVTFDRNSNVTLQTSRSCYNQNMKRNF